MWSKPARITYSFVPDGTSVGGAPSNLQQTLNAKFTTAAWQQQFAQAAAVWQKVANVNLVLVPDNGAPIGVSGNQQSDSRFGDIRIGGYAQSSGQLAFAYMPPPVNGGTNAGDMFFNTTQSWQINGTTYDLMSVAVHEFGHSLGMDHSAVASAVMYPTYNGTKEAVTSDDVNGVRTIYNSRQNDYFDANGANNSSTQADDISPWIDPNGQLTLSALDSTTPLTIASGDLDWFKITVPATTNGTMVVRMQSTGLSVLSPNLCVYNAAGTTLLGTAFSTSFGDTVVVTIPNVVRGQVYDIRCKGNTSGDSGYGAYGLQVNFSSQVQPAVTAPNTFAAEQTDHGGGTLGESVGTDAAPAPVDVSSASDGPDYWVYDEGGLLYDENTGEPISPVTTDPGAGDPGAGDPVDAGAVSADAPVVDVGSLSGFGDALAVDPRFLAALAKSLASATPSAAPSQPASLVVPADAAPKVSDPPFVGTAGTPFSRRSGASTAKSQAKLRADAPETASQTRLVHDAPRVRQAPAPEPAATDLDDSPQGVEKLRPHGRV